MDFEYQGIIKNLERLQQFFEEENKGDLDDYMKGYEHHIERLLYNRMHIDLVMEDIEELVTNYKWALDLNFRDLFRKLVNNGCHLAIFGLLANEKTRSYILPADFRYECIPLETFRDWDNSDLYEHAKQIAIYENCIQNAVIKFRGSTDGEWLELEPKGKKIMIIKMGDDILIRPAGVTDNGVTSKDGEFMFLKFDGLEYKSSSRDDYLMYMVISGNMQDISVKAEKNEQNSEKNEVTV